MIITISKEYGACYKANFLLLKLIEHDKELENLTFKFKDAYKINRKSYDFSGLFPSKIGNCYIVYDETNIRNPNNKKAKILKMVYNINAGEFFVDDVLLNHMINKVK